jgi:hypothetical protein
VNGAEVAVVPVRNGVNGPPLSETNTSKLAMLDHGLDPPQFTVNGFVFTSAEGLLMKLVGVSSTSFTIKAS